MKLVPALVLPVVALLASAPWSAEAQEAPQVANGTAIAEQIACAPMSLPAAPVGGMRVVGGAQHGRIMFGPGEALMINAGAKQGVQTGQRYYVRRHVLDMFTPAAADFTPNSVHTAGWVTIVDVKQDMAVAQVSLACDGIMLDDYLEPYSDPVIPTPALGGAPDYDHPARIVMGDQTMQTGSAGTLMLINRGSDHGVRAGQSLTIFRPTMNGAGPMQDVGIATVLAVRPQTSLMRIDSSRDAVYIGDLAALHRITP
jgi:hypothetical protein